MKFVCFKSSFASNVEVKTIGGWEALPPVPTPRGRCAAASCEGLVFLGGKGGWICNCEFKLKSTEINCRYVLVRGFSGFESLAVVSCKGEESENHFILI